MIRKVLESQCEFVFYNYIVIAFYYLVNLDTLLNAL